jgi:tetraacyldisaccharide 4'-kinase
MRDGDRGPGTRDRETPSPVVVGASRVLEVVNGAVRRLFESGVLTIHRAAVPVISVGNIAMGGTGKTPLVAALATALLHRGARPAILTRGYRRRSRQPRLVVGEPQARWEEIGDEPAVLARALPEVPIVIDADRVRGAATAVARTGATHLVLDDGFQHWRLARDLDVVALDPLDPLCERRPRREHPRALAAADAAVLIDASPESLAAAVARIAAVAPALRVVACRLRPTGVARGARRDPVDWLRGRRLLPFAGIANPRRFLATLAGLGGEIVEPRAFPDHHVYLPAEIADLLARASSLGATPITTAKDAVKVHDAALERIAWLSVELEAEEGDLAALLRPLLPASAAGSGERLEFRS